MPDNFKDKEMFDNSLLIIQIAEQLKKNKNTAANRILRPIQIIF